MSDRIPLPDRWYTSRNRSPLNRYHKMFCDAANNSQNDYCVLMLRDGWYVISVIGDTNPENDFGKFATIKSAIACVVLRSKV